MSEDGKDPPPGDLAPAVTAWNLLAAFAAGALAAGLFVALLVVLNLYWGK